MKKIRSKAIFLLFNVWLCACVNFPEYSHTPHIEFDRIEFTEVAGLTEPDILMLDIKFKDGDGDLGLSSQVLDSPFHVTNFFVGANGQLTTLSSRIEDLSGFVYGSNRKSPKNPSYVVGFVPQNSGKLITSKDKSNPLYNSLPPNEAPYTTCTANYQAYLSDTIFIQKRFKLAVDKVNIVDSLLTKENQVAFYAVLNSWYIESNEGNYNITVQFQVQNPGDDDFHDFDWRKEFCTTYDGRFPSFADKARPIEGNLRYAMTSTGFLSLFGFSKLRLKVQIQDRNFNKSNIITTQVFTLNN